MASLTRLTLHFQCYDPRPLFTRVHSRGNLCWTSNLLRWRLWFSPYIKTILKTNQFTAKCHYHSEHPCIKYADDGRVFLCAGGPFLSSSYTLFGVPKPFHFAFVYQFYEVFKSAGVADEVVDVKLRCYKLINLCINAVSNSFLASSPSYTWQQQLHCSQSEFCSTCSYLLNF